MIIKKTFKLIAKTTNKLLIWLVSLLIVLLFVMLFEIPIPFVGSLVSNALVKQYPTYFTNNKNITINSVALGWNNDINSPLILVKDLVYTNNGNSVVIQKVGFGFSLKQAVLNQKLELSNLYLYGFDLNFNNWQKLQASNNSSNSNNSNIIKTLQNTPYKVISNMLNNNMALKNIKKINIKNFNATFNYNKLNINFNIDNTLFVADDNKYSVNVETLVNVNNNTVIKSLKTNIDVFNNNKVVSSVNFTNWNLLSFVEFIKSVQKNNNLFKNLQFTDSFISGSANINYLKEIKSIQGGLQSNAINLLLSNINKDIQIKSSKLNYAFSKKNNTITINNLNIDFNKLIIDNKVLQQPINVYSINYFGVYNLTNNSFKSNAVLDISNLKSKLTINANGNYNNNITTLNLNSNISEISYNTLILNWPTNLSVVKNWLQNNVIKTNINNVRFNIDASVNDSKFNITNSIVKANFTNTELFYVNGLPKAVAKNVNLTYNGNTNEVDLDIKNAFTGKLNVDFGKVKFVNLNTLNNKYNLGIVVDLNAKGLVQDAVEFIDYSPLNLATKSNIKPTDFNGTFNGDVFFVYNTKQNALDSLVVNTNLYNVTYKNLLFNRNVQDINGNLYVNLDKIEINGSAKYLTSTGNFKFNANFNNSATNYTVNANFNTINKQDITQLNIIPSLIVNNISNFNNTSFTYTSYKQADDVLDFSTDLTNSKVDLLYLGYVKPNTQQLVAKGSLVFAKNNKNLFLDNLELKGDGIDILADILIKENNNIVASIDNVFINKHSNFKGNVAFIDDALLVNLAGTQANASYIFNNIIYKDVALAEPPENNKNNNSVNSVSTNPATVDSATVDSVNTPTATNSNNTESNSINTYKINLNLNTLNINNNAINNLQLNLNLDNNKIKELDFIGYFNNKKQSVANFNPVTNKLLFDIYNAGYMLKTLNLYNNIENGELRGNINVNQTNNLYLDGQILVHDFTSGVTFANASIKFNGSKKLLNIYEIILDGNVMGGQLKGNVKDYKQLYLIGDLTLIPSTFKALTNIPVFKQLRTILGLNSLAGLAKIKITVSGKFGNLKYKLFTDQTN